MRMTDRCWIWTQIVCVALLVGCFNRSTTAQETAVPEAEKTEKADNPSIPDKLRDEVKVLQWRQRLLFSPPQEEGEKTPAPTDETKAENPGDELLKDAAEKPNLVLQIIHKDGKRIVQVINANGEVIKEQTILDQPAPKPAPKPEHSKFIRVRHSMTAANTLLALQTNTVRYKDADGNTVDLIAAVHVGDRDYYRGLNRQFEQYNKLYYELVAPKDTRIPKGGRSNSENPLAIMQQMMKLFLGLEHQLDVIDYHAENLVHADLSPEMLRAEMEKSGDTPLTLFLDVMANAIRRTNLQARQAKNSGEEPTNELVQLNPRSIKLMMAQQFDQMQDPTEALGGAFGNLIIDARNQHVIEILKKDLAADDTRKFYGIFYGAGHMRDFEERLWSLGFRKTGDGWRDAWDLRAETGGGIENLLKGLEELQKDAAKQN